MLTKMMVSALLAVAVQAAPAPNDIDKTLAPLSDKPLAVKNVSLAAPEAAYNRCIAWRQTGHCRWWTDPEPWFDDSCWSTIYQDRSGYCECTDLHHASAQVVAQVAPWRTFDCGHIPISCENVCQWNLRSEMSSSSNSSSSPKTA